MGKLAGRKAHRRRYPGSSFRFTRERVMSNKMWGGRFTRSPDAIMQDINASIDVDRHLFRQDIAASKAHAAMLNKALSPARMPAKSLTV